MAQLIVIGYPDETTADQALNEVNRLQSELIVETEAVGAVVRHQDGKVSVNSPGAKASAGGGAVWGVVWGTLFGMLLFVPIAGAVVGGALGALFGAMDKSGIDAGFRSKVQEQLKPGTSALVMLIDRATPDKAIDGLSRFGGTVMQTSLSRDAEQKLQEALKGQHSAAA
ncbi:MAG TPA: DUF1269 domain-containing protein [Dehalococcoidia bacterium]|jgi:uncharacterized membrane protein|nr:DUF1269 domain-containing protein [Dehalococcoidia bacterium]